MPAIFTVSSQSHGLSEFCKLVHSGNFRPPINTKGILTQIDQDAFPVVPPAMLAAQTHRCQSPRLRPALIVLLQGLDVLLEGSSVFAFGFQLGMQLLHQILQTHYFDAEFADIAIR